MRAAKIRDIVARMKSSREAVWEAAKDELQELVKGGISADEGRQLLLAATEDFPQGHYSWDDPAASIILSVGQKPLPDYVPLIVELFPRFGEQARVQALWLLDKMEGRDAAVAYMDILRTHARNGLVPELSALGLRLKPRHPDVFFPELLHYARCPNLAAEVCGVCLVYCQKGLIDPGMLEPWLGDVLAAYARRREVLLPAQQSQGVAWLWENGYWKERHEAVDLLALLGYFDGPEAESELRRALGYRDALLKCAAVISLLRQGKEVEPRPLEDVAAAAEARGKLWDDLLALDMLELFPKRFRTQEALAESSMVNWLTSYTELDGLPDEIELMKVISLDTDTGDGYLDYYLFRFRTFPPHWAAERGWMAGVAGPYLRKDAPTTTPVGFTFSDFEPWDSMTPEEHVGNVEDLISSFLEQRAGRAGTS